MQFPELETSRLILNQLSEGDGIDLLEIFSDEN
ncbi:N-acetyltransferase, partial [Pseudoalteromonas phenolica]